MMGKNDKSISKMQKKCEKTCRCQKKAVPLHSNSDYGTFVPCDIRSHPRFRSITQFLMVFLERIDRSGGNSLFFCIFLSILFDIQTFFRNFAADLQKHVL